jgi:hypothetical protein
MSKQPLTSEALDDETVATSTSSPPNGAARASIWSPPQCCASSGEETRHWPTASDDLPAYVETDPLAIALNEAEDKAREAFEAFVRPAEDDITAGRLVEHADFMREMRERYRSRDAAE